ncbi:HipA domain-containing protein [Actinoallomurus rhizosphaericola]|uniref:HipA domain-containing protein n=1 Tax=Actinoallomurus rhizosphaericola TaxID=2952536 RepID=UPI002091F122|nr:HipA domain-containing protein [Actinoallomurus rhizosphaericola]MCO5997413.1 HipA domain-containing protein [Actinoallomurus rhizosphaericola]
MASPSPQDVEEYIRRLVAIVVMGNLDAHLKNWTLRYPDERTPRLSPAYDLVAVTAYPEFTDDRLAFGLGGGQSTRLITTEHFRRLATGIGYDPGAAAAIVKSMTERMADTWSHVRGSCPVPEFVAASVDSRLEHLPLMRGD